MAPRSAKECKYASILLDASVDKSFDYEIPSHLLNQLSPGMRVAVPVKGHLKKATILSLKTSSDVAKVSAIAHLLEEKPQISSDLFSLANWMSLYYCAPFYKIIKLLLPAFLQKERNEESRLFVSPLLSARQLASLTSELRSAHPQQAAVLDCLLSSPKGIYLSDLLEKTKSSRSPVETLVKNRVLSLTKKALSPALEYDYFLTTPKKLSKEQHEALNKIETSLHAGSFATHLLYGITGSGKTEVYLQAIQTTLQLNKTVLFLIPEISLTEQTIHRLKSRFLEKIAILHHRMSDGERQRSWLQMQEGVVKIAVGARSALFSPLPHLGLIIVDEEHDSSYKQEEEAPFYHARDVAVMRGKILGATVVLGSATPSLESFYNASKGKYIQSTLSSRPEKATLPSVVIVDMTAEREKAKSFTLFSETLLAALKKRLENGEQSLLFLNRRGYHTSQMCQLCSHVFKCPHCEVALTFHRGDNLLSCHLCDYRLSPPPQECPQCKSSEGLKFKGAGTEQVERALHALFPSVRTLRMDADTTRKKGSHEDLLKQFRSGKADILIGTQMIAKGLHFPSITLVAILNIDAAFSFPDFRAQENLFQLLTQVAGRAGRGPLGGEVVIQTSLPNHPSILLATEHNYREFAKEELKSRKEFLFPPYTRLIKIVFSGEVAAETLAEATAFRNALIQQLPSNFELLPPIPCGHAKIKDRYRFQFLIKGNALTTATPIIKKIKSQFQEKKGLRIHVDVDPLSTF